MSRTPRGMKEAIIRDVMSSDDRYQGWFAGQTIP